MMSLSALPKNTKRYRRDHHHHTRTVLSELPDELKTNILSLLPIEQLLQLRCCNKGFRDLIDSTHFRKIYTEHQPLYVVSQSIRNPVTFLTLIQFNEKKDCRFHFSEYDDITNEYKLTEPITYPYVNLRNKVVENIIVGSCNGLVCYVDHRWNEFPPMYVFNPVIRERLNLTPLRSVSESDRAVNGFGYHPVTKVYKVVRIYFNTQDDDIPGEVEVYTLGTGLWRRIGKVPSSFSVFHDLPGVLVNGALHWYDYKGSIASFDLETEIFYLVPTPFRLIPGNHTYELCAWRESLCMVAHSWPDGYLHISVRINNDQSWIKEFSVPFIDPTVPDLFHKDTNPNRENDYSTFISRTESGKVLQWYNDKLLASYDLEKEERTIYGDNRANYFNHIVLHAKSFVSLKDLGEDAEIMNYKQDGKDIFFLTLIQVNERKGYRFHFGEYDDVSSEYTETEPITHPLLKVRNKGASNIIVGSCNGLVCYADHSRIQFDPIYVFNPVTRELLNLTPLGSASKLYSPSVVNGFGYHPVTKEYKVVRIYFEAENDVGGEVEVYTLGTGEWRRVGKVPPLLFNAFQDFPGVLVNGALHWVDYKGSIASFDLATEIFKEVPSPSSLTLVSDDSIGKKYNLCALREHLCVIHHFKDSRIDIWEQNMDQSWRMEFSFAVKVDPPLCANDKSLKHDFCIPVTFTNSGKLLLWYNYKIFASYDPENRKTIMHNVYKAGHFNEIVVHVKSFVSLKALGEKNSKLIRIQKPRV